MEEYDKVLDYGKQYLLILQELGDWKGEIIVLNNLGNVYDVLGNIDKVIDMYKKSLEMVRKIGYFKGEGEVLCNLGIIIIQIKKYLEFIEYL